MKQLIFFLLLLTNGLAAKAQSLYRIITSDKIGYIDSTGAVVIPAIYPNGRDFSEGLAAVRKDGLYGYINTSDAFVIQPQFSRALSFHRGISLAYHADTPFYINDRGLRILQQFAEVHSFSPGRLEVTTSAGRKGILDQASGKLVIDTLYSDLQPSGQYSIIVRKYNGKDKYGPCGTIDSMGRPLIPVGKYNYIEDFEEGYAWASLSVKAASGKDSTVDMLINEAGQVQCRRPAEGYYDSRLSGGYFRMRIDNKDSIQDDNYDNSYRYRFYDLKGNCVYSDTACHHATSFSYGRVFLGTEKDIWHLADRNFRIIFTDTFEDVHMFFTNGYMVVTKNGKTGILDTNGVYLQQPFYDRLDISPIASGYYFFGIAEPSASTNRYIDPKINWGIADLSGRRVVAPIMSSYDKEGYQGALLRAIVNDRLTYLDRRGNIVWQEQKKDELLPLNVDLMIRGHCYAHSVQPFYTGHGGGYAVYPRPLDSGQFKSGALTAMIDTSNRDTLCANVAGCRLTIANTTADTIIFNAQDNRLYIKLQARDETGKWRDIEYLPNSWCGNSYHALALPPRNGWTFVIPRFEGGTQTRIRAQLELTPALGRKRKKREKPVYVYSNEIAAGINPGQFYFETGHTPQGIMDPYND